MFSKGGKGKKANATAEGKKAGPKRAGWFKSSSDPSLSHSTVSNSSGSTASGSGRRNHSQSLPSVGEGGVARPNNAYIDAECLPVVSTGTPPREVNVDSSLNDSTRFRSSTNDEISVLSSSVAQNFSPHSPGSLGSGTMGPYASQSQIVDALISGLENDRMTDVTLLGKNGAKVRAAKFVLACRSPALQEKLYRDPTLVEVFIGNYGEDSIKAMKEYCHTGEIKNSRLVTTKNQETARGLVELACLAKVYGFEPLYGEADSILYQLINASPWFATACYDSVGTEAELIEEFLLQFIKARCPDLLLETNALKSVSQQRLLLLLDGLECTDSEMLIYLEKWVELCGATRENVSFLRATAARKLSLVRLLEDPNMVSHVRSSGIFDRYMVESIINASPIMEEEEEDDDDDDDDDDDYDDDVGTTVDSICGSFMQSPAPGGNSISELCSPHGFNTPSKEAKKKKKKEKDKKEKKDKKKKAKKASKLKSADSSVATADVATTPSTLEGVVTDHELQQSA